MIKFGVNLEATWIRRKEKLYFLAFPWNKNELFTCYNKVNKIEILWFRFFYLDIQKGK